METRIVKISKGEFYIEYRMNESSEWRMVDKKFKAKSKAEDWLLTHMKCCVI